MAYFNKRYHSPGTAPGTLVPREPSSQAPLHIHLTDYTAANLEERPGIAPDDCLPYLTTDSITWIHVQGDADAGVIRRLGEIFRLHPLAQEDVVNSGQRPKVERYGEQMFVILSHPVCVENAFRSEQVSLFVGKNLVISFHNGSDDPFGLVRRRLRERIGRLRERDADYLVYTIIDTIVDQGFPVLERFGDAMEELERELIESPTRKSLHRLHALRRDALLLRRTLWPHREVLNALMRPDESLLGEDLHVYLRDCYDHSIQILELIETYRDMTTSMLDLYLSSASNRLNEIMRVLTVFASIFIPLTFITGVYGMNFANPDSPWAMPELGWRYGYPLIWGVMIAVALGLLWFFKRKDWL